jgi:Predicted membrane protein
MVELGILLAAFGITLLELSEAGAVAMIYYGVYKGLKPLAYAIAGVLTVMVPTFLVGGYIAELPITYVLLVAAVILFYFGYKLLRSARRGFRKMRKNGGGEEEKEGLAVVYTVSVTESFEAALVLVALIPQSYSSTLLGASIASAAVVALTAALKAQIMKIRLPHLKLVLSSLLFGLGTLWIMEVLVPVSDIILIPLFLIYLLINFFIAVKL